MSTERSGSDFWSRRKAAVREAEDRVETERVAALEAKQAEQLEQKTDDEIIEELGLPDPDNFEEGDDFKAFMSGVVPERLRRRALRRLWTTNPTLANLDGLIDYGEDYTDSATVVENLQTAYQVGKGMLEHLKKIAEEASENDQADNEDAANEEVLSTDVETDKVESLESSDQNAAAKLVANPAVESQLPTTSELNSSSGSTGIDMLTTSQELVQCVDGGSGAQIEPVISPEVTREPINQLQKRMRFSFDES